MMWLLLSSLIEREILKEKIVFVLRLFAVIFHMETPAFGATGSYQFEKLIRKGIP